MRTIPITRIAATFTFLGLMLGAAEAGAVTITHSGSGPLVLESQPGGGIVEDATFSVTWTNNTTSREAIQAATYWMISPGGFFTMQDVSFGLSLPLSLPANGGYWTTGQIDWWVPSAERVLVRTVVDGVVVGTQIPLPRAGYTPPGDTIDIQTPLNLGVNGPLVLVPYSDGFGTTHSNWSGLWIPAQFQVFTGSETMGTYTVTVHDAVGTQFVSDSGTVAPPTGVSNVATPSAAVPYTFFYRIDADKATLPLTVSMTVNAVDGVGNPQSSHKVYSAAAGSPVSGIFPLTHETNAFHFSMGNGPAEFDNEHSMAQDEEYAYDIGIVDSNGSTCSGACAANSDFYVYGKTLYAMHAGTVVYLDDTHPENPSPPATVADPVNNLLIIEGANGVYWIYVHMQTGSVTGAGLSVGSVVGQNQAIGNVGNVGWSSAPHVHIEALQLDTMGHLQPYPIEFTNLYSTSTGKAVTNVPLGSWAFNGAQFYDVH